MPFFKNLPSINPSGKISGGLSLNIGSISSLGQFRQVQALASTGQICLSNMIPDLGCVSLDNSIKDCKISLPCKNMTNFNSNSPNTSNSQMFNNPRPPGTVTLTPVTNVGKKTNSKQAATLIFPSSSMIGSVVLPNTSQSSSSTTVHIVDDKSDLLSKIDMLSGDISFVEPDREQVEAIQKLQYHDFPLTTTCIVKNSDTVPVVTQAKILTSGNLNLSKLQSFMQTNLSCKNSGNQQSVPSLSDIPASSSLPSTVLLSTTDLEPTTLVISNDLKSGKNFQFQGMIFKGTTLTTTKVSVPSKMEDYINNEVVSSSLCEKSNLSDITEKQKAKTDKKEESYERSKNKEIIDCCSFKKEETDIEERLDESSSIHINKEINESSKIASQKVQETNSEINLDDLCSESEIEGKNSNIEEQKQDKL